MLSKLSMLSLKKIGKLAGIFLILAAFAVPGTASAVTFTLPDPTTTVDGVPVVRLFDDFLSYSAKVLAEWNSLGLASFSGFTSSTGTGVIGKDILLMTFDHSDGDNNPVTIGTTDFEFQESLISPTGGSNPTFEGTWGYSTGIDPTIPVPDGDPVLGPVYVDTLLSYLHTAFGPEFSIPVFTFDLNETGNAPDLYLTALVQIIHPGCIDNSSAECDPANTANDTIIDEWSLDNLAQLGNGDHDIDQRVTVEGTICIDGNTEDFCVNNNIGSGKMDFAIVAPTMDLSLYDGLGYWFVGKLFLGGEDVCTPPEHGNGPDHCVPSPGALDNGGEELFISGSYAFKVCNPEVEDCTPPCDPQTENCNPEVPEPGTLTLFGLGLMSLLGLRFRKLS